MTDKALLKRIASLESTLGLQYVPPVEDDKYDDGEHVERPYGIWRKVATLLRIMKKSDYLTEAQKEALNNDY